MTNFIRPEVTFERIGDQLGRFEVGPLERGYGQTLGNSMRRVLLSSLEGSAPTSIKVEGALHEFTAIEGVIEDLTDIVLNIKGLVFTHIGLDDGISQEAVATIVATGPGTVTGSDIQVPTEFTLVNGDHVVANLAEGGHLEMEIHLGVGRGYITAEQNKRPDDPIGLVPVDSLYSPVRRCTLAVEDYRVGQRTDYDKLILEVETNGSITPQEAVVRAADIINQHMDAFAALATDGERSENAPIFSTEDTQGNSDLDKQVEDLDLSVRSYNCLKRAGIHSVRQLVDFSENDLLNIRNFGQKSIEEVKEKLHSMGLDLKQ
ncbi:MAG: DNA-directed RNA polymerase subunit alpha [Coriobacteriia bacterium]|nr:DNA-directed RNA polymerase subunit alpha [Coriobacteriia bacterium]